MTIKLTTTNTMKQIKVYSFEELSNESKQIAIEDYRNTMDYSEQFSESFVDSAKCAIEDEGFDKDSITVAYSLSYSQGDGVSFTGVITLTKIVDILTNILGAEKTKTAKLLASMVEQIYSTGNKGRYSYAHHSQIIAEYNDIYPNISYILDLMVDIVKHTYMSLCKQLEKEGYEMIEYYESDKYITEEIINNELYFLSNGKTIQL